MDASVNSFQTIQFDQGTLVPFILTCNWLTVFEYPATIVIYKYKERSKMDKLQIRFDKEESKYYVYFNGPFGSCAYQSDPFDTLEAAETFKQEQLDSADVEDEE